MKPLLGTRVVSLSINLPGPTTAFLLREWGAHVVKVEPPSGDPLAFASREYYDRLVEGQEVVVLDLKDPSDRRQLDARLDEADLLLTAHRVSALERLGLGWASLHARFPRLCQVSVVGHRAPMDAVPGHDLTYMARHGLLDPPHLPRTLAADLGAAERAAAAALGVLLVREKTGEATQAEVAIAEAAEFFAWPLWYGLTAGEGPLGGGLPTYGIYAARDGYIAVAALEARFVERLRAALNLSRLGRPELETAFMERTAEEWESWAIEEGLPIAAVRAPCKRGVIE